MAYLNQNKDQYTRPAVAKAYISYGRVAVSQAEEVRQELATVPALLKVRPLSHNWYAEATSTFNPESVVICSGTPILVGDVAGGEYTRVGILMHDSLPGEVQNVAVSGVHYMPIDYLGNADPARVASNADSLNGKDAWFIASTGKVTDQAPVLATWDAIKIGVFTSQAWAKPVSLFNGIYYAAVRLDPGITNIAIDLPANAGSSAFSAEFYVSASISAFGGLKQTLTVEAYNADPNYPINAEDITWLVEGTATYTGFKVGHNFTAGAGRTVAVTVVKQGVTTTKNYTVTMHATNAPASWTEV